MRICLLSARFPPQRCGVGDYTYFLAVALARIGYDVHVLTSVGEVDESLYPLPPNANVHRVIRSWGTRGLPEILRHLRKLDPHVLLIQYSPHAFDRRGITFAINVLPVVVRVSSGIEVVTNFHEMYIPFEWSFKRAIGALWQRAAAAFLAAGSHKLTVTSSQWHRLLRHLGIRKSVQLIPVGSNIPVARLSEEERAQLRKELLGSSAGLLVGGFGSQQHRDIPAVLCGLRELKKQGRVKLLWIGGGEPNQQHRASIERFMNASGLDKNEVEWTGVLPHPQVSRCLAACDLIILPFVDGVSTRRTSAVTALQHRLLLLTTRGAVPEPWFIHGHNVYLIPAGDTEALVRGMVELAQEPELRARLGREGGELFDAHFSWEAIAQRVSSVVQGVVPSL
jgi:glycosyltransferase involved in cell wall biosynthesis